MNKFIKSFNLVFSATALCLSVKTFSMEPYTIAGLNNSDSLMLKQGIKTSKPDPVRVRRVAGVKDEFYKNYGVTAEEVVKSIKIKAEMSQKYLNYARERANKYTDADEQIRRSKIFNRVMRKYVKTGDIYSGVPRSEQSKLYKQFKKNIYDVVVPKFGLAKFYIKCPAAGHYKRYSKNSQYNKNVKSKSYAVAKSSNTCVKTCACEKTCNCKKPTCKCQKPNCKPVEKHSEHNRDWENKRGKNYKERHATKYNHKRNLEEGVENSVTPMVENDMLEDDVIENDMIENDAVENNIDLPRPLPRPMPDEPKPFIEEPKPFMPNNHHMEMERPMPMPEDPKPFIPGGQVNAETDMDVFHSQFNIVEDNPDEESANSDDNSEDKDSDSDDGKLKNSDDVEYEELDEVEGESEEPENDMDKVEEVQIEHEQQNTP